MKNNKLYLICIFLFIVTFVSASPIIITPSTLDVNLTKSIVKQINVTISNPYNYSLHNIKAESFGILLKYPNLIYDSELISNESISFLIDIYTDDVGNFNRSINIIGYEYSDDACDNDLVNPINITSSGGPEPNNITIKRGNKITFNNNYGSEILVQIGGGDSIIIGYPGKSVESIFDTAGQYNYDIFRNYNNKIGSGNIHVNECSIYHSGTLDLNIISKLDLTTLYPNFFGKTNYTINFNDKLEKYFGLENVGNKKAINVQISGDWFRFKVNNEWLSTWTDSLDVQNDIPISFEINPSFYKIFETADTGKSYIKTITITGDNILTYTQDISIYINQVVIDSNNVTSTDWWIVKKTFCDSYPDSPLCISEPRIIYENHTIYDAPDILTNMSPADVLNYFKIINDLQNTWQTYSNNWKLDTDIMKNGITDTQNAANQSLSTQIENKDSFNSFKSVFYIIFGTLLFLIMGGGVGFVLLKYYQRNVSQRESQI